MITRLVEGFKRQDPPATPQLAVPVMVPNTAYNEGQASHDNKCKAVGQLTLIAFYFLLRVGEYTQPRYVHRNGKKQRATRTVQFSISNVGFFKGNTLVDRNSPLKTLLQCTSATLKINNQKNGRMGETIHHEAITPSITECPIKALAYRVHHILSNGGNDNTLLCAYMDKDTNNFQNVMSSDIVNAVRKATATLQLNKHAIDPDLVGAHSLRAGGAMALKLGGATDIDIKKYGRWSSLTFTQYIHTQIGHLSKGMSTKMSHKIPFVNVAAFK